MKCLGYVNWRDWNAKLHITFSWARYIQPSGLFVTLETPSFLCRCEIYLYFRMQEKTEDEIRSILHSLIDNIVYTQDCNTWVSWFEIHFYYVDSSLN